MSNTQEEVITQNQQQEQPAQAEQAVEQVQYQYDNEYNSVIYPWQAVFDQNWQRYYYYNQQTSESTWILPEDIQQIVDQYYKDKQRHKEQIYETNVSKFLGEENRKQVELEDWQTRPARKQVEQSLATQYAYKQGDEEYNIWYDKFLTDKKFKEREAALTRCDPEIDSGYTKADVIEKYSTYYCLHFSRGCCAEGVNCKFYHRIPILDQCLQIDQIKDIFGRPRYASHREDMSGVGSFLNECRTLAVTEFRMPEGNDPLKQMYEILWRHFSQWGVLEDINLLPNKGIAYIRYQHRCMAEFAKEAMQNQELDFKEILDVKWGKDEVTENAPGRTEDENQNMMKNAIDKKKKLKKKFKKNDEKDANTTNKFKPQNFDEIEKSVIPTKDMKLIEERKREIEFYCKRMNNILKTIEQAEDYAANPQINPTDFSLSAQPQHDNLQSYQVDPYSNNMPLFTK